MRIRSIWRRSLRLFLILIVCLAVFVFQPVALASPVIAQRSPDNLVTNVLRRIRSLIRSTSRSRAPTGRTRGGAGRGPLCPFINIPVSALVPALHGEMAEAIATDLVFGTTIEAHPTFWFYVPYAAAEGVDTAKFMLLDAERNPVLPEPIVVSLTGTPGFVSFRLPEPYSLEIDQLYNWYFSIVCDAKKPSRNPGVRGWVQRVAASPELAVDLSQIAPAQKYVAYAQNGIWFEMVTDLAENLDRAPTDSTLQADWMAILEELDLTALQDTPIVECCPPKN